VAASAVDFSEAVRRLLDALTWDRWQSSVRNSCCGRGNFGDAPFAESSRFQKLKLRATGRALAALQAPIPLHRCDHSKGRSSTITQVKSASRQPTNRLRQESDRLSGIPAARSACRQQLKDPCAQRTRDGRSGTLSGWRVVRMRKKMYSMSFGYAAEAAR
jgi:hypothetical protein